MRQMTVLFVVLVLAVAMQLNAQGLFETAISGDTDSTGNSGQSGININGHIKGSVFAGENNADDIVVKAARSQLSLKLAAEKQKLGKAFAELRLNAGTTDGQLTIEPDLREAWMATYPGPLDIRLGKQIIVWGRADGINPTNNITPMNNLEYSSELDDTRLGNLLAQVKLNVPHAAIEAIWIPVYAADKLLIDESMVPEGIRIGAAHYPANTFGNCGFALRFNLTFPAADGSVSYFNGYETQPGFDYQLDMSNLILIPRAYRIHAVGGDFSTAVASLGLRGEIAAEIPYADYKEKMYVPNPAVRGVFGIDKTISNWEFLLQYSGCYVIDFSELVQPVLTNPMDLAAQMAYGAQLASMEIERFNRLFVGNADESSHAATARVGLNLLYETLHIELAGMYNVTTEDYAVNPKISYNITDAFTVAAGGRYLDGPDNSLNDLVGKTLSFGFVEMLLSF